MSVMVWTTGLVLTLMTSAAAARAAVVLMLLWRAAMSKARRVGSENVFRRRDAERRLRTMRKCVRTNEVRSACTDV